MNADPFRQMNRMTEQVEAAYQLLATTWAHTDPLTPDLPTSDGPKIRSAEPSDPTLSAIETAVGIRQRIISRLIATTRDLCDVIAAVGYELPATVAHLDQLETVTPFELPATRATLAQVCVIHRTAWNILHDHTMHLGYDEAVDLLWHIDRPSRTTNGQRIPGGTFNRLGQTFHRIAQSARAAIVQPDHPAAGTNRIACNDPLERGCHAFLPIDRKRGQCKGCDNEKQKRRQLQEAQA